MINFNPSIQERIQEQGLLVRAKFNYFVIENSTEQTFEKIDAAISKAGFCPLIAKHPLNEKFIFTLVPYKLPNVFKQIFGSGLESGEFFSPHPDLKIPIMTGQVESQIKEYFKDTPSEHIFKELELISILKSFPHILCLTCAGRKIFFDISNYQYDPLDWTFLIEESFLDEIKNQLDISHQISIDIPLGAEDRVTGIIEKQPGLQSFFEVPSQRKGYKTYAINYSKM